ncbi:anthranilate synthase component I family protein [Cohnella caldifontis]|uniref:anthranilate synthase component I family protein n=1 Tax=Cohnella caldifontis TaxID=3027471 RepID=UPI0030D9BCB0
MPASWNRFWRMASDYACILESGKGGRYTFVGSDPGEVVSGKNGISRVTAKSAAHGTAGWIERELPPGTPIEAMRSWMHPRQAPRPEGAPDCAGGVFGFWSYDAVRYLEKLPESAEDELGTPDFLFMSFRRLWVADRLENAVYLAVHAEPGADPSEERLDACWREATEAADEMERSWRHWLGTAEDPETSERVRRMREWAELETEFDPERLPGRKASMSPEAFQDAVRRIQAYISQGDVFQVNLSVRQSVPVDVPAEELYDWLRIVNPSPYMGMLRTPAFSLVSASPELLVKLDDGRLSARPIAGTRRRGRTPDEDRAMEQELLASEKERAEHIMLVDLERNDLGRVAAYGSVKVPELLTVERYSHVMHLVSQVEARLAPGKDALDVVAAMFPGGTITGAPKIRTMEIIEELEPVRRGPYTGSMGWIDYAGNMEFNIIIRTVLLAGGVGHIQAGAGIVIDSDPRREYQECLNKAKALWKALLGAGRL